MGLSLYEMEVSILMNRADDFMELYVSDPAVMRRLSKLKAYQKTREHRNGGEIVAMEFRAPKKLLTLRGKAVEAKPMTDEQKAAARERMLALRERLKSNPS